MITKRLWLGFILSNYLFCFTNCSEITLEARLSGRCYGLKGHINIGLLYALTKGGMPEESRYCDDVLHQPSDIVIFYVAMYAVEHINQRRDILPNITLGFVILDDCGLPMASIGRALQLTEAIEDPNFPPIEIGTTYDCNKVIRRYPVSAVLGPSSSSKAVAASSILSFYKIPHISAFASSDELSDKQRFGYFFRLVPPDRFQAQALTDFIASLGWEYFMLIYSEDGYGENGAKYVQKYAKQLDLCLALSYRVPSMPAVNDKEILISNLRKYKAAKAVILFANPDALHHVFAVVQGTELEDNFIWVASDYFAFYDFESISLGTFALHFRYKQFPIDFNNYLNTSEVIQDINNTWVQEYLTTKYNCTWYEKQKEHLPCQQIYNTLIPKIAPLSMGYHINQFLTLAQAMDDVIKSHCPEALNDVSKLETCVTGSKIRMSLKSGKFQGLDEEIHFDENGDRVGGYSIKQYQGSPRVYGDTVAEWDSDKGITLLWKNLNWGPFMTSALTGYEPKGNIPESLCSRPCGYREIYIQKELRCCWQCIPCRKNEKLNENRTSCEECPATYWPDTEMTCVSIPPTYIMWKESTGIGLALVAVLCLIVTAVVAMMFVYHRSNRLIKATSRELSALELVGIALAFLTVFAILHKPTNVSCTIACYGFAFSVCFIYAPLLVKTTRIYRIFAAGKKGLQKPSFIGMKSQLVFCFSLLICQIIICAVSGSLVPAVAKLRMPVSTTRFVELYCDLTLRGMLSFLVFNLILILGCGVLGFLTRKLPQNFNESWYIFVSVSTTIFVWIVFLPTYFSSFYATRQTVLLALCLLLNAGVTLLCQYIPKIYAIYFVAEEKLVFVTMNVLDISSVNTVSTSATLNITHSRKVAPSTSNDNI